MLAYNPVGSMVAAYISATGYCGSFGIRTMLSALELDTSRASLLKSKTSQVNWEKESY